MSSSWPFDDHDRARIAAALDEAVPGSVELGALDYLERLLTALDHEPPRVWAAPPGSGSNWLEMGPWERQAWAERIATLRDVVGRVASGNDSARDRRDIHVIACESTYADPAYGGNRDGGGWQRIGFPDPLFPPARMDETGPDPVVGSPDAGR